MDWASVNRQRKVLAMVGVVDADFRRQFPKLDAFDQAGRIADAARDWNDATWLSIAKRAGYKSDKTPGSTTREMLIEVYRGRATAPLSRRAS